MKKLITLILVLSTWNSFAQLTLVRETDKEIISFQLQNGKIKYFSTSSVRNKLKSIEVYNDDLSLFKSISISSSFPHDTLNYNQNSIEIKSFGTLNYSTKITDNFFNSDNKIEFIVSYKSYMADNNAKETCLILNEDGLEIFRFYNPIGEISLKYLDKFQVDYNNRKSWGHTSTKLYSVPGNLPCPTSCNQKPASISPIDPSNAVNKLSIEGFPNPTSEKITLAYTLPKGSSYGTIRLYSQTGTLVKEFKVSDQFDHLELPVADYAAGTYFYELQVDGNSSGGKKMLVVH